MIKTLHCLDEVEPFLPLLGHAEFSLFDLANAEHRQWLTTKIDRLLYCGAQYFAIFDAQQQPLAVASVLVEPRPASLCDGWQSAELMQIAVREDQRKCGWGSQLLSAIEASVRSQRVSCLYLHTYPADYDVIAFYGKNGFMPTGLVPDFYGPGLEGKLYLRKVLAD
ncbi:GNAT family N-acetyltransferase [Chitinibacteraceae bacterium HSL-7]